MRDLLSATRNRRPRLPQNTGSRKPIGGNVDDTPSTAGNVDQRDKLIGRRRYRLFSRFRLVFLLDIDHSRETLEFLAAVAAQAGFVRLHTTPPTRRLLKYLLRLYLFARGPSIVPYRGSPASQSSPPNPPATAVRLRVCMAACIPTAA
jgi:hypothetical protein